MKKKFMKRSAARLFCAFGSGFKPFFREIILTLMLGAGLGLICDDLLLGLILGAVIGLAGSIVQVGA